MREVGNDGQDPGGREADRIELLAVVFGIAEREIATLPIKAQLAASEIAQPGEHLVDADEKLGRRDVVIDEHHAIRERVRQPRRSRTDREVVDQDVVGSADVDELAIVARQGLHDPIRRLDEDVRAEPRCSEHALNPEHLVPDGVAVPERRQDLVDGGPRAHFLLRGASPPRAPQRALSRGPPCPAPFARARSSSLARVSTGPVGALSTTSRAGGTLRLRRANQPGSGAGGAGAGSRFSRSKVSRYFRSITGQV
jgi:hypothetical protein